MVFNNLDLIVRINELIEYYGLNPNSFAEATDIDPSNLNKMLKGKQTISSKTITKITSSLNVNKEWLISGVGNMLNKKNKDTPTINYSNGIPYYNVDFIGGFDLIMNDQTINPEYLIDFKKYNEATCWCNVTGHSMEPEITHGDIIALKKIEDITFLPYGEVYAIVTTNDMRTIKRIGPASNPNNYSLIPTNKSPEYGIQELPKNMIRHIFHVLGCMKRL